MAPRIDWFRNFFRIMVLQYAIEIANLSKSQILAEESLSALVSLPPLLPRCCAVSHQTENLIWESSALGVEGEQT
jgi:hypothetical protein